MTQLVADSVRRILNSSGKTITYKKVVATRDLANLTRTNTKTSYTIKAHFRTASDNQLEGNVHNQMREVRISPIDLGFVPQVNDEIIADGKTYKIEVVDIRNHGEVDLLYILKVRGN